MYRSNTCPGDVWNIWQKNPAVYINVLGQCGISRASVWCAQITWWLNVLYKCASHMYTCNTCPGDVLNIQVIPRLGMGQDSHTCELSNQLKKIVLDQGWDSCSWFIELIKISHKYLHSWLISMFLGSFKCHGSPVMSGVFKELTKYNIPSWFRTCVSPLHLKGMLSRTENLPSLKLQRHEVHRNLFLGHNSQIYGTLNNV